MKKLILILAITALVGCSKDDDDNPSQNNSENVEQYVGSWSFNSPQCTFKRVKIEKGTAKDELIFDGISGIVVDKVLVASGPFAHWEVTFGTSRTASAIYNQGACSGSLVKN